MARGGFGKQQCLPSPTLEFWPFGIRPSDSPSRQGNFHPMLLGIIRSEEEEKAHLFSSLYSKGLTTEQIG